MTIAAQKYFKLGTEEVFDALQFTGDNRLETRVFFVKAIVIRQGKFFAGAEMGYVVTGDWLVKDSDGNISKVANATFVKDYWPV